MIPHVRLRKDPQTGRDGAETRRVVTAAKQMYGSVSQDKGEGPWAGPRRLSLQM